MFILTFLGTLLVILNLIRILFYYPNIPPRHLGEEISKKIRDTDFPIEFSFIVVIPIALINLLLIPKIEKIKNKSMLIIINSINLFLSIFIAWLLFGLARGM